MVVTDKSQADEIAGVPLPLTPAEIEGPYGWVRPDASRCSNRASW